MTSLPDREKTAWLRLIRSESIGARTFDDLIRLYGAAEKALEAIPELARRGGKLGVVKIYSQEQAEKEMEAAAKAGARILTRKEEEYPEWLCHIPDPPPVLTVLGNTALFSREAVAIVGTRNASANGRRFAHRLAQELGEAGYIVISGLARGIDTAAHEGALERGTAAVVAGGMGTIYPPENETLYHAIAKKGVIVTEQPYGAVPRGIHFPRRNRIISGLSRGVVVVEAALRSGSLITARMALEQGREVFAVPGFPMDPRAAGPNRLLRQGAVLVECASDIVEALKQAHPQSSPFLAPLKEEVMDPSEEPAPQEAREIVLSALGFTPAPVDMIATQTHIPVSVVLTVLLELELAGKLERHSGNRVALLAEPVY